MIKTTDLAVVVIVAVAGSRCGSETRRLENSVPSEPTRPTATGGRRRRRRRRTTGRRLASARPHFPLPLQIFNPQLFLQLHHHRPQEKHPRSSCIVRMRNESR
jgi:hypothetical protein